MFKDRFKNILFFVLYVVFHPEYFFIALKVHLPTYIQMSWLTHWKIKTFVDVGAHEGQEVLAVQELIPGVKVFAFEPQDNLASKLLKYSNQNVTITNAAVGEKNQKSSLLIPQYTPGASILKPSKRIRNDLGQLKKQSIEVITLDSFFTKHNLIKPVLLKIDTQGYELNVLKGAQSVLKNIDIIYIETPLEASYDNSAIFEEIYGFLRRHGFSYHGAIPDGQFWPKFELPDVQNSIFVKDSFFEQ